MYKHNYTEMQYHKVIMKIIGGVGYTKGMNTLIAQHVDSKLFLFVSRRGNV
jgi:hypothetical protein